MSLPTAQRLTLYAPRRSWERTRNGFSSHPWTAREVLEYRLIGGWFMNGAHDFADREAAKAASCGFKE